MAWKFQNPKTGDLYDVEEQYDEATKTDVARDKAISKGYIPVVDVVNPKTGNSHLIDDRTLEKAMAKGYKTRDVYDNEMKVSADRAQRQRETLGDGIKGQALSAAKGFADTASFGFGDEIGAAVNAPFLKGKNEDLVDAYKRLRDSDRSLSKESVDVNPVATGAGMAAAIAPTLLAGAATKAPTLASAVKAGAAEGAAFGAGASEADLTKGDVANFAKDTAMGSALGGGMSGLGAAAGKLIGKSAGAAAEEMEIAGEISQQPAMQRVAGDSVSVPANAIDPLKPVIKEAMPPDSVSAVVNDYLKKKFNIGDLARKGLGHLTSTDDEMMKKYLANRTAVNNARGLDEISADVVGSVDKLKDKVIAGSANATDLIPDSYSMKIEEPLQKLKQIQAGLGEFVDEDIAAKGEISRLQERLKGNSDLYSPDELSKIDFGTIDPSSLREAAYDLPGTKIKDLIKSLDRSIQKSDRAGEFMTPAHRAKVEFREFLDSNLKSNAGEYKKAMNEVSADAQALELAKKQFGKLDATSSRLKSLANRPQEKQEVSAALNAIDQRLGTKLHSENDARKVKEYFEEDLSGGRGPRNRLIGAGIGGTIGALMGPVGAVSGAVAGAQAGQALDRYGRKIAKAVLDRTVDSKLSANFIDKINAKIPSLPPQYKGALQEAAQRGGNAVAVTHFLLGNQDPEYRAFMERDEDEQR